MTYKFETTAKDGYIKIPDEYKDRIGSNVKVIIQTETHKAGRKSDSFPYFCIDTSGYRFDREAANER